MGTSSIRVIRSDGKRSGEHLLLLFLLGLTLFNLWRRIENLSVIWGFWFWGSLSYDWEAPWFPFRSAAAFSKAWRSGTREIHELLTPWAERIRTVLNRTGLAESGTDPPSDTLIRVLVPGGNNIVCLPLQLLLSSSEFQCSKVDSVRSPFSTRMKKWRKSSRRIWNYNKIFFFHLSPAKRGMKMKFHFPHFCSCKEGVEVKLHMKTHLLKIWAHSSFSLLDLNVSTSSKSYLNGVHWTPLWWEISEGGLPRKFWRLDITALSITS